MAIGEKKPNLEFVRELGGPRQVGRSTWELVSEGIALYLDDDGYLEIKAWNADSDSFIIILSPLEIGELKDLLKRTNE